jgi:hypothetical protein
VLKKRNINEKRQSMVSDGLRLIRTRFPCPRTRHRLNARHQRRLTVEFGNEIPAISYVVTFFSTNTYLNGTYYISKLSEKYKEFYSIKIIPVL